MNHQSQFPDPVVDQLGENVVMKKEMNITHLTGIFIFIIKYWYYCYCIFYKYICINCLTFINLKYFQKPPT